MNLGLLLILRTLWQGKGWVFLGSLLAGLGGLWYALVAQPLYESRMLVALKANAWNSNAPAQLADLGGLEASHPDARLDFMAMVFSGNDLLRQVILENNLQEQFRREMRLAGKNRDYDRMDDTALIAAAGNHYRGSMLRTGPNYLGRFLLLSVRSVDPEFPSRFLPLLVEGFERSVQVSVAKDAFSKARSLEVLAGSVDDPSFRAKLLSAAAEEDSKNGVVNAHVLDQLQSPLVPETRQVPNRKQILLLSLLIGFFISSIILLVSRRSFRTVLVKSLSLEHAETPSVSGAVGNDRKGFWSAIWAVVLLFLLVYDVSFIAFPFASTGRIAVGFLLVVSVLRGRALGTGILRENPMALAVFGYMLIFAFAASITGTSRDFTQASRIFWFLLYAVIGSVLYLDYIGNDFRRFHKYFMLTVLLQSLFHIFSFFSPEYRDWVAAVLVRGSNFDLSLAQRPPGFANSAGASFSVIQALGFFSSLLVMRMARTSIGLAGCAVAGLLALVSTVIAGRTGLVMCVIFSLYVICSGSARMRNATFLLAAVVATVFIFFADEVRLYFLLVDPTLESAFTSVSNSAFEIFFHGRVGSVAHVYSMEIPPISFETLLGTGRTRVVIGEGHDSGYVQTYLALGLIMSAAFYITCLLMLLRNYARLNAHRYWLLVMIAVLFFVETKEPFIFKYAFPFYVLACLRSAWMEETHPSVRPAAGGAV